MIDKDALIGAIDAAKENSYGTDEQSTLGSKRRKAIEYYLGLNTNPAPEGRSQVVDRSVYETIQTQLPSLVKIFAGSSEEVCKATPIGPDDEAAAEQHTAVLNYIVTQQNNWEQISADWIWNALVMCNGYCMAYWDDTENIVQETYEDQSDDQVASLLQDPNITVLQHSQEVDDAATQDAQRQWQQMAQQSQMQGMQPPPFQEIYKHTLVIERKEHDGKVCIRVLPPEHCYVSADTPDWTLKECPYFEFKQEKTIADLRSMGLDVPDDINDNEDDDSVEDDARDRFDEDRDFTGDGKGSMRRVWARMIWVKADVEGDENARLYYVIAVGRTILFSQQMGRIPVASMTAQPMPHRHIGMSEAETVTDIQDIRTFVTRGGLDNLALANSGRNAISSKVNLEDFLDARPGGVVRMLDDSLPAEGHIMPLVHPMAFDQIIGSLEYFDQIRQNRTGASRYFAGTDANAINKTASGTIALQNMASMRVEHKARMMAPAVEELFSCVQEIMQKHANKALTIKLKGQWVTVDPQAWRTKRDLRISVGVGAGNKDSMAAQLQGQLGAQLQLMPLGLAGPEQIYATVIELAKLGGFANPGKFWKDPTNQPPQPPQPGPEQIKAQTQLQIKQMELQADAQKFQATTAFELQKIQATTDAKMREVQATLELQYANDARDAEREQTNAIMANQLERQRIELEQWKTQLLATLDKYKTDRSVDAQLQVAGLKAETDLTKQAIGVEADTQAQERQLQQEEQDAMEEALRVEEESVRKAEEEELEMKAHEALTQVNDAIKQIKQMQHELMMTQKDVLKAVNAPRVPIKKDGKTVGSRPARNGEI